MYKVHGGAWGGEIGEEDFTFTLTVRRRRPKRAAGNSRHVHREGKAIWSAWGIAWEVGLVRELETRLRALSAMPGSWALSWSTGATEAFRQRSALVWSLLLKDGSGSLPGRLFKGNQARGSEATFP